MNTKDFEEVAEDSFNEYQADLSKEKAVEEYRQQLLKALEEMKENPEENAYMKFAEMIDGGEGLMAHARIHNEALGKVIDLLKAKDYMED